MGAEQSHEQQTDTDDAVFAQTCPRSIIRPSTSADISDRDRETWLDAKSTTPGGFRGFLARLAAPFLAWIDRPAAPELTAHLPPPPPLPRKGEPLTPEQAAEAIMDGLFLLPPAYVRAVRRLAKHAEYLQECTDSARIEELVYFAATRLSQNPLGAVPIALIRARLDHVDRCDVNSALGRLAKERCIELTFIESDNAAIVAGGLTGPDGKRLTHVRVLDPR